MFMTILVAFRPLLFIGGLVLLGYVVVFLLVYPEVVFIASGLSLFLFLLVFSDRAVFWVSRVGAWIATLRLGKGK